MIFPTQSDIFLYAVSNLSVFFIKFVFFVIFSIVFIVTFLKLYLCFDYHDAAIPFFVVFVEFGLICGLVFMLMIFSCLIIMLVFVSCIGC